MRQITKRKVYIATQVLFLQGSLQQTTNQFRLSNEPITASCFYLQVEGSIQRTSIFYKKTWRVINYKSVGVEGSRRIVERYVFSR